MKNFEILFEVGVREMPKTLELYNKVALCMAYCSGATDANAREIADNIAIKDIEACMKAINEIMA